MLKIHHNLDEWGLSPDIDNAPLINSRIKQFDKTVENIIHVNNIFTLGSGIIFAGYPNITFIGKGGFKAIAPFYALMDLSSCENLTIEGLTFDANELLVRGVIFRLCNNITLKACTVTKVGNLSVYDSATGISFGGCVKGSMTYCNINNIVAKPFDPNETDLPANKRAGAATGCGVSIGNNVLSTDFYIAYNTFQDITPVDDGDGLKFFPLGGELHCRANNNLFINCAKRGIKVQGSYVTTKNNIIINSRCASIDFQGSNDIGRKSINDTIIINDPNFPSPLPYYGICASGQDVLISGTKVLMMTPLKNSKFVGAFIYTATPDMNVELNNMEFRGVHTPIWLASTAAFRGSGDLQDVNSLTVKACEFIDCEYKANIRSGGYYSGGGPVFPTIKNLCFQSNYTKYNGEYEGPIHRYTSADYTEDYNRPWPGAAYDGTNDDNYTQIIRRNKLIN